MLSSDEFETKYVTTADNTGNSFRTWDEAHEFDLHHVWTIVDALDGTNNLYVLAGYHVVNAIGYIVTEEPWEDESIEAYWFKDEESEDEEKEL